MTTRPYRTVSAADLVKLYAEAGGLRTNAWLRDDAAAATAATTQRDLLAEMKTRAREETQAWMASQSTANPVVL